MSAEKYSSLIYACLKKDERAYHALYKLSHSFMLPVCRRYARSESEAREFLNIGFYKVLTSLRKYEADKGSYESWSRRVIIYAILDELRRRKQYRMHTDAYPQTELERVNDNKQWHSANQPYAAEDIYRCIRLLPPLTASVFNLYAIDGYKHREIAQMLEISLSASKWHYANARKRLQSMLTSLGYEAPLKSMNK